MCTNNNNNNNNFKFRVHKCTGPRELQSSHCAHQQHQQIFERHERAARETTTTATTTTIEPLRLQGRRQRRLRQRRSNLCGCNSGNNNNNRTRSVENADCGRARWHENVKELREQEGELVARCPVPSPDLCGVEEHPTTTSMPTTKPFVQEFCEVGNRNSARVDAFHMQSQL